MSKKRDYSKYDTYIQRVLKQVHPDTGISGKAMADVNAIICCVSDMICSDIRACLKGKTCTSRDVQTAVRLCLPGELAKHAVSEGTKAVRRFNASAHGVKGKPQSKAKRAGLLFPPSRAEHCLRAKAGCSRVGGLASIYLAAVIEYLVAEVLELAGNATRDFKKVRITPRHITLAIRGDEELGTLLKNFVSGGGIIPHIHRSLLPKKTKQKSIHY